MIVRDATIHDLLTLVQIDTQSNPYPWTLIQFTNTLNSNQNFWIADDNGQVLGFLVWQNSPDEAEIYHFAIDKQHRRQGIGQTLFDRMTDFCRNMNVHKIFLEVRASNLGAQAFYQENGFKQISLRRNYYTTTTGQEDALIMKCLC